MKRLLQRNPNKLTVEDHAKELRNRLFVVAVFYIAIFAFILTNSNTVIQLATELGVSKGYVFVYLTPQEVIIQQLKLSMLASVIVSIPIIFYEALMFVVPAIKGLVKISHIVLFFFIGCAMLALGAVFAYKILLPFTIDYLINIGATAGIIKQVSIEGYLNFIITIVSSVALTFELPLVCVTLCKLHITNAKQLAKLRPFIVVSIFILAALITPPDVFTQCIVALPMVSLFEVSILICRFIK